MLQALKMQHVTFQLMTDEVPHAAVVLASMGMFSPDQNNPQYEKVLLETPAREYRELYHSAKNRLDKIYAHLEIDLPQPPLDTSAVPTIKQLEITNKFLTTLWSECSRCEEHQREIDEQLNLIQSLQASLKNFAGLKMNLQQLRQEKTFLDLQVGLVPQENLGRLRQAARLAGYMVEVFHVEKHQAHILLAGLQQNRENMQSVLNAAGYRTFPIPEAFDNTPEVLHEELSRKYASLMGERAEHVTKQYTRANQNMDDLLASWRTLKLLEPLELLGNATRSKGELAVIQGWVPEDQLEKVTQELKQSLSNPVHLESHEPATNDYSKVPTVIRYPRWMTPFVVLTRSYGTPRYGEVDPSWLFALSSILLFGIMFGDVGHGLVLLLAAIIFRKPLKEFSYLIAANGISSIGFGFVYGSIFGNEHLLTPLWQSPLHHPTTVLMLAIYIGATFVGLAMLINVYNQFTFNNRLRAFFSPGGLPGLMVLGALLLMFYAGNSNSALMLLSIFSVLFAFILIGGYLWKTSEAPLQEKVVVIAIEMFETLISLLSNVLSFLRVGAFSLNHVALMLAVFAIAEMLPATGYWLMLVIGNLFVILFEGAIVMIQVLRLEYYEGLSRYFYGDGNVFRPLQLDQASQRYRFT